MIIVAASVGVIAVTLAGWALWALRPGQPPSSANVPAEQTARGQTPGAALAPEQVADRVLRAYTAAGVKASAAAPWEQVLKQHVKQTTRPRLRASAARNLQITRRVSARWLGAAGQGEPLSLMAVLASRAKASAYGALVVDGYDVQVAGVEGHRAQATWRSWQITLVQHDGRWLVSGVRARRGPAPQSTSRAAGADGPLVAELRAMAAGKPR